MFSGGLGQVTAGMTSEPDIHSVLYRQSVPDVLHGCLLEGIALALEGRFEPFSQGRRWIMPQRVREIEAVAARHGICLAPLYNGDGPLELAATANRGTTREKSKGARTGPRLLSLQSL